MFRPMKEEEGVEEKTKPHPNIEVQIINFLNTGILAG